MPRQYLLDTSVFSQPLRRKPVMPALKKWVATGDCNCAISVVTLAEIEFGLNLENSDRRREKFDGLLRHRLPVLPADEIVWSQFAKMKARQQAIVQPVSDLDLLIAATALVNNLRVATLNHTDFSRIETLDWEDWSR